VFGEWYGARRGLGVLLITAMQAGRADRLWAASLLSAACGVIAFGVLSLVRAIAANRYGTGVTQAQASRPTASGGLRHVATEIATVVLLVGVLIAAWWAWIEARNISAIVVPPPSRVFDDIVSNPGDYASAAWNTLFTAAIALLIGSVVGLVAALISARFELLAGMTVPVIVVLAATPLVALFPLLARVLGYNPTTVWVLAAVLVFYPVFVFTRSGLTAASPAALDVVDSLGGTKGTRYRSVVLPSAIPHIASGLRIAAGSAVIAAVVGESLIGREGLGVEFAYSYNTLELPRAFGAAVVIVAISVVVFALAGRFERTVHDRWA
jgi:NitT/TauT family transport system permease protein